jgi:hypothetical protein
LSAITIHNWLAIATLALNLIVVAHLLYLEQRHMWFGPEDGVLIIISGTLLVLLIIDGMYLTASLGIPTRVEHHLSAFGVAAAALFFLRMVNSSLGMRHGRRLVRATLYFFMLSSALIFMSYWVSSGAALGWWLYPEQWSIEEVVR